ncbi:MAG TPA: DUF1501 domain-containing protein [Tepidisphaeraceae bacterium]|jgi:uncharacterized protein (DUF1501 family)|nr:DUF1501 domain-containing protein [Tepidisphaeraceae bacterium]
MSCSHDRSNFLRSARELHALTRRQFFNECGIGVGKIALASLLAGSTARSVMANTQSSLATPQMLNPLAPKPPHFPAKAKRVIYMFMVGAPSQLDLFDNKPTLVKYDGHQVPEELTKDARYAFIEKTAALMSSRFKYHKYGQSGMELSEVLPHLGSVADDICLINSMKTEQFNHAPAQIFTQTGSAQLGRPSMGSWVSYGLGTESTDLPGFVVLTSGRGTSGGPSLWGPGFLPTIHQGVLFRGKGDPVLDLANPAGVDPKLQRDTLDLIHGLNTQHLDTVGDPEISTRINAFEMAYKMQTSALELTDLSKESKETLEMYGVKPGEGSFAANCLLARRLIERGVRFVQLYHADWDHHSNVEGGLRDQCGLTDKASAALIKDLKQRGLLDDTIVVWGGEFGRTPMVENSVALGRSLGRDHHPQAYSAWVAGGGFKGGTTFGQTDDLGFKITQDPVHVHDLQATILNQLGLDHTRLTYHYQGRDFRLTDVEGTVVRKILA